MKHIEISKEFLIQRFGHGIKLIRPDKWLKNKNNKITIADLFEEPLNVWLCDSEYACVKTTEDCANVCGMDSAYASIGKTAFDFLEKKQAIIAVNNDRDVMINDKLEVIEFDLSRRDGMHFQSLTFKFPWYNNENKIVGTLGCGIIIGRHNLAESISKLISFDLLNTNVNRVIKAKLYLSAEENDHTYFSQRELQCLRLTVRGKSAKQVATELGLSRRTIEEYLNNVKNKFGVLSKAELIDKALDYLHELDK